MRTKDLSDQVKERSKRPSVKKEKEYDGNTSVMISTGSTLLDLAISGGRVRGGGLPGGIMVEAFGPSASGKTVLLCEIAGAVKRASGQVMFMDPEARLDKHFAKIFDLDVEEIEYRQPDLVKETFEPIREWEPENPGEINGIFADSLAALSTEMEMEKGDKMGMKRAKDFSEECRKTCRVLKQKNYLLVCSNQIRENADAGPYGQKHKSPGGLAIGFYSSLRLKFSSHKKLKKEISIKGKKRQKVNGVKTDIEVFKSTVWEPYHTAPVYIIFDYGIDDIRGNLQFIKDITQKKVYTVGGESLSNSMLDSIMEVEEKGLEKKLKEEVIEVWEDLEEKFREPRKGKVRV